MREKSKAAAASRSLVVLAVCAMFAASFLTVFTIPSYAAGAIVQSKCAFATAQAQLTGHADATLTGAVTAGNTLIAVVTITGSKNTAITNANVTDNHNAGNYKLWIRSVDQSNTLYVGVYSFNSTAGIGAGGMTVTVKYAQSPNTANQALEICAYEVSGLGSGYRVCTNTTEGGGASQPISCVGDVVVTGYAQNTGTGTITCSCTKDDDQSPVAAIGHGGSGGSWGGVTGQSFVEEADAGFSPAAPTTCVCTVVVNANVTTTSFVTQNASTPFNWGALVGVILIIAVIALFYILRHGSSAGGPNV